MREVVGVGVVPTSLSVLIAYPDVSQIGLMTKNSNQRRISIAKSKGVTDEKAKNPLMALTFKFFCFASAIFCTISSRLLALNDPSHLKETVPDLFCRVTWWVPRAAATASLASASMV